MKRSTLGLSTSQGQSHRLAQLSSLLQHELGLLLTRELELPAGALLTVSRVTVLPDLSAARIGVTILPWERHLEVFQLLQRRTHDLQRLLNAKLHIYRVPKLEFQLDDSTERADRLEQLLDKLDTKA